jgi:hypothetical protein
MRPPRLAFIPEELEPTEDPFENPVEDGPRAAVSRTFISKPRSHCPFQTRKAAAMASRPDPSQVNQPQRRSINMSQRKDVLDDSLSKALSHACKRLSQRLSLLRRKSSSSATTPNPTTATEKAESERSSAGGKQTQDFFVVSGTTKAPPSSLHTRSAGCSNPSPHPALLFTLPPNKLSQKLIDAVLKATGADSGFLHPPRPRQPIAPSRILKWPEPDPQPDTSDYVPSLARRNYEYSYWSRRAQEERKQLDQELMDKELYQIAHTRREVWNGKAPTQPRALGTWVWIPPRFEVDVESGTCNTPEPKYQVARNSNPCWIRSEADATILYSKLKAWVCRVRPRRPYYRLLNPIMVFRLVNMMMREWNESWLG